MGFIFLWRKLSYICKVKLKTIIMTALQDLIEELKEMEEKYRDSDFRTCIQLCIDLAEEKLEKEKEQIIKCWENGYEHGACVNEDKDKYHGIQYYNENYKKQ